MSYGHMVLVPNQTSVDSETLMRILRGPSSYPDELSYLPLSSYIDMSLLLTFLYPVLGPCLGPALAIGILSTSLALKPSGLRSRCAAVIGISFLTGGFLVLNGALFLVLLFFTEKEMLFQTLACFFRFGVQLFYGWLFGTNSSGDRSSSQAHGPSWNLFLIL
jgi:hypothetical protein